MSGSRSPSSIGGSPSGTGGSMKNGRSIAALVTRIPTPPTPQVLDLKETTAREN